MITGEAISTFLLRILWSDPKLSEICPQWPRSRRAQEDEGRGLPRWFVAVRENAGTVIKARRPYSCTECPWISRVPCNVALHWGSNIAWLIWYIYWLWSKNRLWTSKGWFLEAESCPSLGSSRLDINGPCIWSKTGEDEARQLDRCC
jgi:hypothetical protein